MELDERAVERDAGATARGGGTVPAAAPSEPRRPARPRVVVTRRLPDATEARMTELFEVELNGDDRALNAAGLIEAAARADVLVPTVTDRLDSDFFAQAGDRLRLIANFGNGVDHIDLKAARRHGIIVTNTPGVLTEDTADMVMGLILWVPRRLGEGERLIRSGAWSGWSPNGMLGHRVNGKRLGILGMGRIGQAVARRAHAFRLSVHYHNRRRLPERAEAELGATWHDSLESLVRDVDILTINCPHTAETHRMIGRAEIALMPQHLYLINTARGEIVDEAALAEALAENRLAGAGLDVFEHEPAVNQRLLDLPNVVLLPHMGSATHESRRETGNRVITNIRAWVDGHRPPDQVLEGWV